MRAGTCDGTPFLVAFTHVNAKDVDRVEVFLVLLPRFIEEHVVHSLVRVVEIGLYQIPQDGYVASILRDRGGFHDDRGGECLLHGTACRRGLD